ncbi:MAG: sensor domain-containing protein [Armatimonadota bacterium]
MARQKQARSAWYRRLADSSPNWVTLLGANGRIQAVNGAGLAVLGYTLDELRGKHLAELWPEESRDTAMDAIDRLLRGEIPSADLDLSAPDGRMISWQITLNPISMSASCRTKTDYVAIGVDISNQKHMEHALQEREEAHRMVLASFSDIYARFDTSGEILVVSPSVREHTGYDPEELVGHRIDEYMVSMEDVNDLLEVLLAEQLVNDHGLQVRSKDGLVLDFSVNARLIPACEDRPACIEAVARDITERKRSERDLAESQDELSAIFENTPLTMLMVDENVCIRRANRAAAAIAGRSTEEMIGMRLGDALHCIGSVMDPRGCGFSTMCKACRARRMTTDSMITGDMHCDGEIKYTLTRDEGQVERYFRVSTVCIHTSGKRMILVCAEDITDGKRSEELMHRYKLLSENAYDIILFADEEGRILEANEAAVRAYGYSREELLRASIQDISVLDRSVDTMRHDAGADGALFETVHRRKDGSAFPVEVSSQATTIAEERVILSIIRDITERKQAEDSLRMQTSMMNAAGDQIVIANPEGSIEFVNPAFEQETGYRLDEVQGKNINTVGSCGQGEAFQKSMWDTILSGRTWQGEVTNKHKDGSICTEEMTVTPVSGQSGEIEHFIAIKRNITDKKVYEEKLDHLAHHDHLTGLPNRLMFGNQLSQKLALAERKGQSVGVMFLDLDRFKVINDTLGHNFGDELLRLVADRLSDTLRQADCLARMGGDEFTVILSDAKTTEGVARVARRIQDALAKPFVVGGQELFITCSMGVSLYPTHGKDVETLVKNADTAMYRAKDRGRNGYQFYSEAQNTSAFEQIALETALRKALERDEFVLHYQPRVQLDGREILGAEALLRWRHPDLGLLMPSHFIHLAEEIGLIIPITEMVLRKACRTVKSWLDAGLPPVSMAVNISAREFQHADLVGVVKSVLDETELSAEYLELELTESAIMQNPDLAARLLEKLKSMGLRISIDDFGTGYSSLSRIKHLPIDTLKIDQSFIRGIPANADDTAIAAAIVAMAHSMRLRVIAEGVETLEQIEFLNSIDCDEIQGYFVSGPVPDEEFANLLANTAGGHSGELSAA